MMPVFAQFGATVIGLFMSVFYSNHRESTYCDVHKDVQYCYYRGDESTDRVVYFFHGFGNNVKAWGWNPVTRSIESDWKKNQVKRPHVVTASFGQLWWYDGEAMGKKLSEFISWIETKEKMPAAPVRVLYGDSMGGHNSFRFAHDFPKLFSRLAMICPGLPLSFAKNIRGDEGKWPFNGLADNFINGQYAVSKLKNPLRDEAFWKTFDPLPPVHLIVSTHDHFGFYSSGTELYEVIKAMPHGTITFEDQDVFHCLVKTEQLSKFLAQ